MELILIIAGVIVGIILLIIIYSPAKAASKTATTAINACANDFQDSLNTNLNRRRIERQRVKEDLFTQATALQKKGHLVTNEEISNLLNNIK